MFKIISWLLSIIITVFPFLGSFREKDNLTDKLQIVTMTEDGSDIVLFTEDGEAVDEEIFAFDGEEEPVSLLPSKYSAVNDGLVTSVKNQGNTGCCWAFAAISAAETSMIKKGLANNSVDYSEAHLTWFGLKTLAKSHKDSSYGDGINSDSPFTDGGNWCRSLFALARWSGVQKEENIPFEGFPYPDGNYPESERYESFAHLQNSQYIPETDRDGIKQAILDCGSITASYYHSNTFLKTGKNGEYCYYQNSVKNTNHTIAVVGWDDEYSKDNFKKTPAGDGAWLVKNSWGGSWGGNGYFWLSYYDTSLSYFITFEMESADNYENINQYDGFGYKGWGFLSGLNQMSMANVFKTKADETVRAVSFHTVQPDIGYTVEIYTDIPAGGSPTDGNFITSERGYMKYRGYRTVELSDPVSLPKGTRYSVVVTLRCPEGVNACIPFESPEGFDGAHERQYYGEKGQSYLTVSRRFDEWEDTAAAGFNNVCIKSFSDNNSLRLVDTSDYVLSDGALGYVKLTTAEDVLLKQFRNKNIYFEDGVVCLRDENGKIIDSAEVAYLGDVDNDGDLDYDDLELLRIFACGAEVPTKREWFSADVRKSRHIDAGDIALYNKLLYDGGAYEYLA